MDHDQSVVCAEIYVKCMLPTLRLLEGTAEGLSESARNKAVKIAADRSLALISSGSCWSAALKKQLRHPVEENCPDTKASNQVSDGVDILPGFNKMRANSCSSMHNPVKVHLRKQKSLVNSESILMKARNYESRLARDSAFCRIRRRCTVTSRRRHSRYIYTRNSRHSKNVNFVTKSFSSEDRSCHSRAKAISCKLGIHHKVIFKKFKRKALKKLMPKVKQVRSSLRDEVLILDRVQTLQKLVPGGAMMKTDHLLHEAEDYIYFLRFQVDIMKSLLAAAHADARSFDV